MQKFSYKAITKDAKPINGLVEAIDEKQAIKILREKNLFVVSLARKSGLNLSSLGFNRVSIDDKVNFTRQLSTMINAGLPITESLDILIVQSKPKMAMVISEILREVESGGTLSGALEKHPAVFGAIYISLVKAGESAGVMNEILNRLADTMEKQRDFQRKIKSAMIYPVIVIVGMGAVMAIMVVFVMPKMSSLYSEFQAELPLATRMLLGFSKIASSYFWLLPVLAVGGIFGWRFGMKSPLFRNRVDQLLFKVPIFGKLKKQMILAEFTRTLGLLISSGVLVIEALGIVKNALGSQLFKVAVEKISLGVERGLPLAATLEEQEIFPPILSQMVSIGEETGKLDEILVKVAGYFEEEAETSVKNLTTAMEPLIMIILGVGVGFLMMAVIMPIYQLTNQF